MAISMKDMLQAGVHFGHQTRYWNPKMKPYIFGARNKIHIINLEKTMPLYYKAVDFLSNIVAKRGRVLFVGTKKAASTLIAEAASRAGMPYVDHRWLGGMLTNYKTVRKSVKRLHEYERMEADGEFDKMIKKEALKARRNMVKLNRSFAGIKVMGGLPDALFVIDSKMENIAIEEAKRLKIPVVAVVDTNSNPDGINYVIPGNDDARRAIRLYLKGIVDAILDAKVVAMAEAAEREALVETEKRVKPNKKQEKSVAQKVTVMTKKATAKAGIADALSKTTVQETDASSVAKKIAEKVPAAKKDEQKTAATEEVTEKAAEKVSDAKTTTDEKKSVPTADKATSTTQKTDATQPVVKADDNKSAPKKTDGTKTQK